jgi:parvulin-like peptidyl-prolyl isomerase
MIFARKTLIALCVLTAAVGLRVHGQATGYQVASPDFTRITKDEVADLLADIAETNPMVLTRFRDDPELRRGQLESLRQLLAFAVEARHAGLADSPLHRSELEFIRREVIAINYDRHINKPKGTAVPFASITAARVAGYWGDPPARPIAAALQAKRNASFQQFLDTKVALRKSDDPSIRDSGVSDDERAQARDLFTKIEIYADEYARRSSLLPLSLRRKVELQVKLQQAQFLARLYSQKLASEVAASDDEIAAYLKNHPELDPKAKRAKAEEVLSRAKAGEDFAKLANEFSEDPGNQNDQGETQGGLYKDVTRGTMVAPFEQAALALEPGKVAPALVETEFGFHIIKLERKGETYDVRHILFATGVSDQSQPNNRPVPVREYAEREIEKAKENVIIDRIVAANKISVPEDFVVPSPPVKPEAPKTPLRAKPRPKRKRT